MCGRFTNQFTWRELVDLYGITEPYLTPVSNLQPRFNFAPMQQQIVIRRDKLGRREPVMMRWGPVPSWARDKTGAAKCINAKAETVEERPSYRDAFRFRPCLVPANGFYEWLKIGPVQKQPFYLTTKTGEPFAFAGLWDWWRPIDAPDDARNLETFTILTTQPNAVCAPIHNRMPVMLARGEWTHWLRTVEERRRILRHATFPAERMEFWPVGKSVGSVDNEGPQLIKRIDL